MRLILFIFLIWSAAATAETRLALLISNEKYPEKAAGLNLFGPLGKAHRDREEMAKTLKNYRFEIIEVLDADKDKTDAALVAFTEKLEKSGADSVGVIYFVGHGAEVGGKLHLIPTQEKLADDKAIKNRTVSADELIDRLTSGLENGKNQGVRLLILDACRSRIKTRGVNERKVDLNAHGALVGYAAASGKEALDSDDSYTMHLTKQMQSNGHLKIEEVFKKARIELAKASGNNQISLEYGGLLGDFCLGNCQVNSLEQDLKAKEKELADLKQKLAQNTVVNPDEIQALKKRLKTPEQQNQLEMEGINLDKNTKSLPKNKIGSKKITTFEKIVTKLALPNNIDYSANDWGDLNSITDISWRHEGLEDYSEGEKMISERGAFIKRGDAYFKGLGSGYVGFIGATSMMFFLDISIDDSKESTKLFYDGGLSILKSQFSKKTAINLVRGECKNERAGYNSVYKITIPKKKAIYVKYGFDLGGNSPYTASIDFKFSLENSEKWKCNP